MPITSFKSFLFDITYETTCLSYKSIIVDKYALDPLNIKFIYKYPRDVKGADKEAHGEFILNSDNDYYKMAFVRDVMDNDEKTMLSVKINLSENDFLTQKYFDFLQDIDDYNAKQEKKNNKKRH